MLDLESRSSYVDLHFYINVCRSDGRSRSTIRSEMVHVCLHVGNEAVTD